MQISGGEPFVCNILPLVDVQPGFDSAYTLVAVQTAQPTEAAVKHAERLYGLTARECDILFGMVEIGGATAVASTLGLSAETVKTHLRALYAKTRTHRQSDLVKLVLGLMSPLR